jgi:hypothetical protein
MQHDCGTGWSGDGWLSIAFGSVLTVRERVLTVAVVRAPGGQAAQGGEAR